MQADCPACPTGVLEYEDDIKEWCRCDSCGARYTVEPSANCDGDHWTDDSTRGERIE